MSMYIPSNEIISESARRKIIPSNPLDYLIIVLPNNCSKDDVENIYLKIH